MFKNSLAGCIVDDIILTIQRNKDYLSEIDGKIGDGDHGINMNKGMTLCAAKLKDTQYSMSQGFLTLSQVLMDEIGGSMGPLYGLFFEEFALASQGKEEIDARDFLDCLSAAIETLQSISNAQQGDKTLMDTLLPARSAFKSALNAGASFNTCLVALTEAARKGWLSTQDLVAKIGRASRLGERSRGCLDAGATSCYLILGSMAETIQRISPI